MPIYSRNRINHGNRLLFYPPDTGMMSNNFTLSSRRIYIIPAATPAAAECCLPWCLLMVLRLAGNMMSTKHGGGSGGASWLRQQRMYPFMASCTRPLHRRVTPICARRSRSRSFSDDPLSISMSSTLRSPMYTPRPLLEKWRFILRCPE